MFEYCMFSYAQFTPRRDNSTVGRRRCEMGITTNVSAAISSGGIYRRTVYKTGASPDGDQQHGSVSITTLTSAFGPPAHAGRLLPSYLPPHPPSHAGFSLATISLHNLKPNNFLRQFADWLKGQKGNRNAQRSSKIYSRVGEHCSKPKH